MSVLVTLGNTNLSTFGNVCHAVMATYPEGVKAICHLHLISIGLFP
jgi:hypothetical protein